MLRGLAASGMRGDRSKTATLAPTYGEHHGANWTDLTGLQDRVCRS